MAYNNFYPATYQPYQYPQQYQYQNFQQIPQQMNNYQSNMQQQPQQIQNGGFVSVRDENEARNYPVALGNSVTFIDENAPYCYTKTMGFSQLDRPKFEKYRLVKEEDIRVQNTVTSNENPQQQLNVEYAKKDDIVTLWNEIEALKKRLNDFENMEVNINGKSDYTAARTANEHHANVQPVQGQSVTIHDTAKI